MNRSNFNQPGGFPLKTERLQEMQTAYSIFNSLGALAGNLTIISGCTLAGSNVGDGVVNINGELLDFRQAAVTPASTVVIIEEAVNRGFKNGVVKQVHAIRYATFGTAETSWLWTDFKRVDAMSVMMARITLLEKKTAIFQEGGAAFPWFKSVADIPPGFQEVLNIRGRTIIGYDPSQTEFNTINSGGGSKMASLITDNLPPIPNMVNAGDVLPNGGSGQHWVKSGNIGYGKAFSILNPYRIAMYIEFIG